MSNIGGLDATCIYCDQPGPFTDEHVFPAGLGGDDRRYVLEGIVCGRCNTEIFSKLELSVARRGPEAFARLFLQPEGRGSGKKASIPSLDASVMSFIEPNTKAALEAELLAGGTLIVLPQVVFSGEELSLTGPSSDDIDQFLAELERILGDELCLIKKIGHGREATFEVETYSWIGHEYVFQQVATYPQPPARGIWWEDLSVPVDDDSGIRYLARLFRRRQGQLVLRILPGAPVVHPVSTLRRGLSRLQGVQLPSVVSVERPSLHVGLNVSASAAPRVVAKIGVNVACHEYGDSFVRLPAFDAVKQAILTGEEHVAYEVLPNDHPLHVLFAPVPGNLHLVMITASKGLDGRALFAAVVRLYGGVLYMVKLADDAPPERTPVFFTVDYTRHVIDRYAIHDFVTAFGVGSE